MSPSSRPQGALRGPRLADPALEAAFRAERLAGDGRSLSFFTLIMGLAPLLVLPNDLRFLGPGPGFQALLAMRLTFAVASLALARAQRRAGSPARLTALTVVVSLAVAATTFATNASRPPDFLSHVVVDVAVVAAYWTMLPIPFPVQAALGLVHTLGQAVVLVAFRDPMPPGATFSIVLAYLLINVLGGAVAWRHHASRRREWLAVRSEAEGRRALEAAHQASQAASRAKSAFLAGVSHEILTPLNPILGFTEVLLARRNDPEDREALLAIAASGRALHGLLSDVLDLAAGEVSEARLATAPCDLAELVSEVAHMTEGGAAAKGLRLETALLASPPPVLLDRDRLRQVLLNLATNAVRHTAGGRITLRLDAAPTAAGLLDVELSVSDTGAGVSAADRLIIFEPFRQGPSAGAGRGGGVGLGLALARRLVERMGGQLTLDDGSVGGSTFRVRLPGLEPAPAQPPGSPEQVASTLPPARLLVVDDEDWNRSLLRAYLRPLPIQVVEASSGDEAIAALLKERPDAVLLDLAMPGTDGPAVLRWARARPELAGLPFIAVTAHARKADAEDHYDGWLQKPVARGALLAALAQVLPAGAAPTVGAAELPASAEPRAFPDGPEAAATFPAAETERLLADAAALAGVPLAAPARALAASAAALAVAHGQSALAQWATELRRGADALDAERVRAVAGRLPQVLPH